MTNGALIQYKRQLLKCKATAMDSISKRLMSSVQMADAAQAAFNQIYANEEKNNDVR